MNGFGMNVWAASVLVAASSTLADVMLGQGETYTYRFMTLEAPPWLSPGLPPYDDYTFALNLSGDVYNKPPDDIRIRLFEDPDGLIPDHEIFGESVPNLSVSPSRIAMTEVPGDLWFDYTGRIEVEVLAGSVNITHMNIDLGPGDQFYSSYIEAVPEPGSLAMLLIGAGGLLQYRRARRQKGRLRTCPDDSIDVF